MGYVEAVIGLVALLVALRALNLQRYEIIKNGKINSLIHMSSMLQSKIDYHNRIIDDLKKSNEAWGGHAARINNELRPLKEKMDEELISLISKYEGMPELDEIKMAIRGRRSVGE